MVVVCYRWACMSQHPTICTHSSHTASFWLLPTTKATIYMVSLANSRRLTKIFWNKIFCCPIFLCSQWLFWGNVTDSSSWRLNGIGSSVMWPVIRWDPGSPWQLWGSPICHWLIKSSNSRGFYIYTSRLAVHYNNIPKSQNYFSGCPQLLTSHQWLTTVEWSVYPPKAEE